MKVKSISIVISVLAIFSVTVSLAMAGAKVRLTYTYWGGAVEKAAVEKMIEIFNEKNPDIEAVSIHIPSDYAVKLQTMIAGGNAPDVFKLGADFFRDWLLRDVFLDLTPLYNSDPDISLKDYAEIKVENFTVDGRTYGMSGTLEPIVTFYNRGLFDKAGLPYPPANPEKPWKWDEFLDVARKLTVKKGDETAQFAVEWDHSWWGWMPQVWANGGDMYNADATRLILNEPRAAEAIQMVADLENKYGVDPKSAVMERMGLGVDQMLSTGRVAMNMVGQWKVGDFAKMGFPLGVGVLPTVGTRLYTVDPSSMTGLYKRGKNIDAAWKLYKHANYDPSGIIPLCEAGIWIPSVKWLLNTPEGQRMWVNKDVHPPEFVQAVIGSVPYAKPMPTTKAPGWSKVLGQLLTPALDQVWLGKKTAMVALGEITSKANEILEESRKQ
jgi:multiple sugar transport system substrate-binding protein